MKFKLLEDVGPLTPEEEKAIEKFRQNKKEGKDKLNKDFVNSADNKDKQESRSELEINKSQAYNSLSKLNGFNKLNNSDKLAYINALSTICNSDDYRRYLSMLSGSSLGLISGETTISTIAKLFKNNIITSNQEFLYNKTLFNETDTDNEYKLKTIALFSNNDLRNNYTGYALDASGNPIQLTDKNGQPKVDQNGNPVYKKSYVSVKFFQTSDSKNGAEVYLNRSKIEEKVRKADIRNTVKSDIEQANQQTADAKAEQEKQLADEKKNGITGLEILKRAEVLQGGSKQVDDYALNLTSKYKGSAVESVGDKIRNYINGNDLAEVQLEQELDKLLDKKYKSAYGNDLLKYLNADIINTLWEFGKKQGIVGSGK